VLSLIAAHFLGTKAGIRRLLAAMGCAVAAFLVSTPGAILQWPNFIYGLTYELHHAAAGHGLTFAGTGNGFIYTFTSSLWYGLGPAGAILFAAAVIYGFWKLDRKALVVLAFALPYYVLLSLSQVRFARYTLPMFPAAALLIAWMACDLWSRFPKCVRWAWAGLCAVVLIGTLLYTIALDGLFVQTPPQDRAARWIFANIPKGSTIGVVDVPWFYSPPYAKDIGLGTLAQRIGAMRTSPYRMEVFPAFKPWSKEPFGHAPGWVVLSDYEVSDAIRIGLMGTRDLLPEWVGRDYLRIWLIREFVIFEYAKRAEFSDPLTAFGIPFGSTEFLPHDMRYPAPTISIYEYQADAPETDWIYELKP
jgi:hypothetical protein